MVLVQRIHCVGLRQSIVVAYEDMFQILGLTVFDDAPIGHDFVANCSIPFEDLTETCDIWVRANILSSTKSHSIIVNYHLKRRGNRPINNIATRNHNLAAN